MWDALRLDVRHSFRSLRRAPTFSLIVIVTLALAVGATAALGSLLNALVLRRLPVPSPEQLVALSALEPQANVDGYFYVDTFNAYRVTQRSFAQMSMYSGGGLLRVETHSGVLEDASTEAVSPSYFDIVGARLSSGRFFTESDDAVVVISEGFRRRRFGNGPAIGEAITVNAVPATVIGVMADGFHGLQIDGTTDLIVPFAVTRAASGDASKPFRSRAVVGRLARGVSIAAARAELFARWPSVQAATLPEPLPEAERQALLRQRLTVAPLASGFSTLRDRYGTTLWVLLALIGILLAVACAMSYQLWQSAFGAREDVIGQSINVDGVHRDVIGIMPPGFDVMDRRVELWLPLQLAPTLRQFRASHFLSVVGRLKDGVAKSQAETELDLLVANWSKRTGASGHVFVPDQHVLQIAPALDEVVGSTRRVFWLLQAGVGMVLVLACANLASLLVVRAEVRGREVAVRKALGAGPRRLLAQFVVEGLVLLVLGSALGLAIASAGVHLLAVTYHDSLPRVADMGIDPSVLGFTLLISVITGVVFAVAPLRYLSDRSGGSILSYRAPTQSTRTWMRRGLVAGEVALAVVLVSSAGLMIRTVLNLMSVESGFDRSRLVTFAAALPASSYPLVGQRMQVYDRLIDRLSAMPGIEGVAGVTGLPPRRGRNVFGTDIEGYVVPFCSINCPESFRPLSVAALGRASAMRTSTL